MFKDERNMTQGRHLPRFACILLVSVLYLCVSSISGFGQSLNDLSRARADAIRIDALKAFGPLEKSPVEFLHEAHTNALAKMNKDCTACHLTQNGRIFPKFMRLKDTGRIAGMNLYHKGCISCHGEMNVAGQKTGPVQCDGCHRENSLYASSAQPMGFDKSLHYRHSQAEGGKCGRCHHEYNEKTKTLFYAKGKEGTCRYCHKPETEGNVVSMKIASHIACVNCHLQNRSNPMAAGPVTCSGCHDRAAQQKIEKIASVPRMVRHQPDAVLIKSALKELDGDIVQNRMNFVPFDHQAHESYTDTCRVCHHDSFKPCNQCHTLTGATQGKGINLEDAMHRMDTSTSCIGCHAKQMENKNCAGCHAFMGKSKAAASCLKCHMMPVPETGKTPGEQKALAAAMLKSRNRVTGTYPEADIPETVTIKSLSNQYEGVVLPHRKIVEALVHNIKDSKLAGYFHGQAGAICQGCHHHSPVSKTPPHCGNCHAKTFDEKNPLRPGLKGAYHLQCMGCHREMGIQKPSGCTDCHKKKA
jgi:hypothetical protein